MKSLVVYYSQSGNTKTMAQAIHAGMKMAGGQCDIARLQDLDPRKNLADYDLIGLGGPVQRHRELPNMTEFIGATQSVDGRHGFAFATHGALPGTYMANVVPAMQQRGLTVIGWKSWFASVLGPPLPKPYFTDGHPDAIDLKEGEDFGREMVEKSRRVSLGESQLVPTLPTGKDYDAIYYPYPVPADDETRRKSRECEFSLPVQVNTERCNYPKCTHCIDNCPTHSIAFPSSPPVFSPSCCRCWVCEQTCPRGAIEVDYTPFQKLHDPVTATFLQKELEAFEARGWFRRLVPLEEIGWDTPMWTFKKPRFKVP